MIIIVIIISLSYILFNTSVTRARHQGGAGWRAGGRDMWGLLLDAEQPTRATRATQGGQRG